MRNLSLLLCSLALLYPTAAQAQRVGQQPTSPFSLQAQQTPVMASDAQPTFMLTNSIAAIVNNDIITTSDLKNRIRLVAFSSGMPGTQEVMQNLLPRVLRTLINEQLQLQESRSKGLNVTDTEINLAIVRLAEDNKVPNGDMAALLSSNSIPFSALRAQVKANLAWKKVVLRTLRPRVNIGKEEVEAVVERLRANNGRNEYLISEIFLPVEKQQDEGEVRTLAYQLVEQLKTGTRFGALARQFSQGLGASTGGDLGWIQEGQLSSEIDAILPTMEKSTIIDPVHSTTGYHILGLRDKRTISTTVVDNASIKMKQAFRPFSQNTSKEALLGEAAALKNAITSCNNLESTLATTFPLWRLQDLGDVDLDTAPEWLVDQVKHIPVGHAGAPMATGKGALILFVCERNATESINRDAIRVQLGTEKMELLARRLQRDLRRDAYLDIRLK